MISKSYFHVFLWVVLLTIFGCSAMNKPYRSTDTKESYVFKTKELSFDSESYGVFCSNEYSTRVYLNVLVAGPFNSLSECEVSDALRNARAEQKKLATSTLSSQKFKKYKKDILNGNVKIGMPREVVILILGEPGDINTTETKNYYSEQLVYGSRYVYIRHGKVSALQGF